MGHDLFINYTTVTATGKNILHIYGKWCMGVKILSSLAAYEWRPTKGINYNTQVVD